MPTNISKTLFAALMATTASFAVASCSEPAPEVSYSQQQIEAESVALYAFFDRVFEEDLQNSPFALAFRGSKDRNSEWDDFSEAEQDRQHLQEIDRLAELRAFNFGSLSEEAQLSYRLYQVQAERSISGWDFRYHDYPINQFFGWHTFFPVFMMNIHRVDTVADAEAYITRLETVKVRTFDELNKALDKRAELGILPPAWVYPFVYEAIGNVLTGAPFDDSENDTPILADFKRKVDALEIEDDVRADMIARAEAALVSVVQPAYQELLVTMQTQGELASDEDGAWKLPDGEANYNRLLANYTTTDLTAEEIHQIGLENVDRIHDEMREIMVTVGYEGSLHEFFVFMRDDPQFYYDNTDEGREAYMADATTIIDTMREAIPAYFSLLPQAEMEVKRVEPFRENSSGKAFYNRPAEDGSRPGVYYANLKDMADMPSYQMEGLAYHEGIPGHHMQISIAMELEGIPEFQKQSGFTAYTEGWGLYSEYLPKEMGFYQDPYSDFGRLAMELWRAARLVVDTGLHYKKWTGDEAKQYLRDNTPNPEGDIVSAINRYIVIPGQATAYMIGKMKILDLREWAKGELGDAFDLSDYHDEVLRQGAVPLDILEENIAAWVEGIKAGS